ncbi:MAG: hypothetical protein AAF449_21355 [Myxococcota bacterium]
MMLVGLAVGLATRVAVAQSTKPSTTNTSSASPELLELARQLEILEDFELLLRMDILELMPVLEDNDER